MLDDLALEACDRYLKTKEDLSKIIAEIAERENLTTEQIKRVIERANRAVFLKLFPQGVHEFPIASFDKVIEHMSKEDALKLPSQEEDLYVLDEFDLQDPSQILREELGIVPQEEKKNDHAQRYAIVVVSVGRAKKAAQEAAFARYQVQSAYKELEGYVEEALKYVSPRELKAMVLRNFPKKEDREFVEKLLDEIVKKKHKPTSAVKKASAKEAAVKIASAVQTPAGVAALLRDLGVSFEEVKAELRSLYKTAVFDGLIEQAKAILESRPAPSYDASAIVGAAREIAEGLDKIAALLDEMETYLSTAREQAAGTELEGFVKFQEKRMRAKLGL
ncbi:MAG: hypothetical protein QW650_00325 [Thermofilum sp.]